MIEPDPNLLPDLNLVLGAVVHTLEPDLKLVPDPKLLPGKPPAYSVEPYGALKYGDA